MDAKLLSRFQVTLEDAKPLSDYRAWLEEISNYESEQRVIAKHNRSIGAARGTGISHRLRWLAIEILLGRASKGEEELKVALCFRNENELRYGRNMCKLDFPLWLGGFTKARNFKLHPKYGSGELVFVNVNHPRGIAKTNTVPFIDVLEDFSLF